MPIISSVTQIRWAPVVRQGILSIPELFADKDETLHIQPMWLERAIRTAKHHAYKLKENPNHTIFDTAVDLRRSIGGVSEDLLIVSWLKTHEDEITKCKYAKDALKFIRDKKKHQRIDISHLSI